MAGLIDVDPSCAISGPPPDPQCPHESQRLELALNQAMYRWSEFDRIRSWVLDKARNSILARFAELKARRYAHHIGYLQSLPCFTLYQRYHGNPPVNPSQLQILQQQIATAQTLYKAGIDDDWRKCCLEYPAMLDYFFDLVELDVPDDDDLAVLKPPMGIGAAAAGGAGVVRQKQIKARRGSRGGSEPRDGRRRKQRRRPSRGRTPPRR